MMGWRLMPKTIQLRDLDDDVYEALRRRASEAGLTVPELLRREATRLAGCPTVEEWLARRPVGHRTSIAPMWCRRSTSSAVRGQC